MERYETRGVLAGAYLRRTTPAEDGSPYTSRTHTVSITDEGRERVLCGRVVTDNLADPFARDTAAAPTCATCLRRDPRFKETT